MVIHPLILLTYLQLTRRHLLSCFFLLLWPTNVTPVSRLSSSPRSLSTQAQAYKIQVSSRSARRIVQHISVLIIVIWDASLFFSVDFGIGLSVDTSILLLSVFHSCLQQGAYFTSSNLQINKIKVYTPDTSSARNAPMGWRRRCVWCSSSAGGKRIARLQRLSVSSAVWVVWRFVTDGASFKPSLMSYSTF